MTVSPCQKRLYLINYPTQDMTLRQYFTTMLVGAILAWAAWLLVIFRFDPTVSGAAVFFLFYAALFMAIFGSVSAIGFWLRLRLATNEETDFTKIKKTFKQGALAAAFVVLALLLLQKELLTWWNFALLAIFYLFLEGVIFANRRSDKNYV